MSASDDLSRQRRENEGARKAAWEVAKRVRRANKEAAAAAAARGAATAAAVRAHYDFVDSFERLFR